MKFFLTASIHGVKKTKQHYQKIVELVEKNGHTIKSDHILQNTPESMQERSKEDDIKFHKRVLEGIKGADVVLAELSYSSTSVGYLVALAVNQGKPVVIFFSGDEEPHLFRTLEATNDKLLIVRYKDVKDLEDEVPGILDFVTEVQDTRFNFFVSPSIAAYLDWISRNRRVPRAVYLRKLIDSHMEKDKEYNS